MCLEKEKLLSSSANTDQRAERFGYSEGTFTWNWVKETTAVDFAAHSAV